MTSLFHTYGRSCLLADDEPELASLYSLTTPPEIRAQFFYVSSLPIDDPLAPLPASSGQATGNERTPPTPFSARDNQALESAWLELGKERQSRKSAAGSQSNASKDVGIAVPGEGSTFAGNRRSRVATREDVSLQSSVASASNPASLRDDPASRGSKSSSLVAHASNLRGSHVERHHAGPSVDEENEHENPSSDANRKRERSSSLAGMQSKRSYSLQDDDDGPAGASSPKATRSRDVSISGSPFARAATPQPDSPFGQSVESLHARDASQEWQAEARNNTPNRLSTKPSALRTTVNIEEEATESASEEPAQEEAQARIVVGASRLHSVELPDLQVRVPPYIVIGAYLQAPDETYLLEPFARHLQRYPCHVVLQKYHAPCGDSSGQQIRRGIRGFEALDRHMARRVEQLCRERSRCRIENSS